MNARAKSKPKVIFAADAGREVGGGHVMRCLTLAGALGRAGAECAFAATPEATAMLDAFAGPEVGRFPAPSGDPAALCALAAQSARTWGAGFAVLDHYGAGAAEDALLRAAAGRLLAIEDLRRRRECDLLLDASLGRKAKDYPRVEALLGPGFALVRPEFAALLSAQALARRGMDEVAARSGLARPDRCRRDHRPGGRRDPADARRAGAGRGAGRRRAEPGGSRASGRA